MIYRFENYALDAERRELSRDGERCPVEPQVFDLLIYLVKHRDRVVSRHDIFQAVWRGRLVSDAVLSSRINAVRRAIGDDGVRQRLIRTSYGSGFRFVGAVHDDHFESAAAVAVSARHRLTSLFNEAPAVLVQPLAYIGDDKYSFFAEGLSEEIIGALYKMDWLYVVSQPPTFAVDAAAVQSRQAAQKLGARYLLQGSLRQIEERTRVTVKLVDGTNGRHLWVEAFDYDGGDILRGQQDIARKVAAGVSAQVFAAEEMRTKFTSPEQLNSWEAIVSTLALMNTRSKPRLRAAATLMKKAVAIDPGSAPAFGLLSFVATLGVHLGWYSRTATQATALRLAEKALALNSDDAWAHVALGYATVQLCNRPGEAVEILHHALKLNPNLAIAHYLIALSSAYMDKPENAFRHADLAERLGPHDLLARGNPGAHNIVRATASFVAGRHRDGIAFARKAVAQTPGQVPAYRQLVTNCALAGEVEEASVALRTLKRLSPNVEQWLKESETTWSNKMHYQKYMEAFGAAGR